MKWWKRPLRRVTQADYRHGFKFIAKVRRLMTQTKARAEFYKDVACMPRLSTYSPFSHSLSYFSCEVNLVSKRCSLNTPAKHE